MTIVFASNNLKIALDSSLVLAPYLPHFEFVLSDLKSDGCANQGFTKLLSIQEAKIKYFKFEILICFNFHPSPTLNLLL